MIVFADYGIAEECRNSEAWFLCLKCGRCGRRFEKGIMIDNGGTHERREDEDEAD